jgi:hypothetical protein
VRAGVSLEQGGRALYVNFGSVSPPAITGRPGKGEVTELRAVVCWKLERAMLKEGEEETECMLTPWLSKVASSLAASKYSEAISSGSCEGNEMESEKHDFYEPSCVFTSSCDPGLLITSITVSVSENVVDVVGLRTVSGPSRAEEPTVT